MCVKEWRCVQQTLQVLSFLFRLLDFAVRVSDGFKRVKLILRPLDSTPTRIEFVEMRTQAVVNEVPGIRTFEHVAADKAVDVANLFHADGLIENFQRSFAGNPQP